jgi:hypothetical protein
MVFLPCLIIPLTWLAEAVSHHMKLKPAIMLVLIVIVLNQSIVTSARIFAMNMTPDTTVHTLASFIENNTAPDEPILYVGNYCRLYLVSGHLPATYYAYKPVNHHAIIASYFTEFMSKKPQLIAYGLDDLPEEIDNYINENYTVVYEHGVHKVCKIRENNQ